VTSAHFHVAGPSAAAVVSQATAADVRALEPLRHATHSLAADFSCRIRRHDVVSLPGFDLICPTDYAGELHRRLTAAGAVPAHVDLFEILRVEAGMPQYGSDFDEARAVMEVGRTKQAICY